MKDDQARPGPFRAVIFDLDDTLFDCSGLLTGPARKRASIVIAEADPELSISEITKRQEELSDGCGSSQAIVLLVAECGLPADVSARALAAYNEDRVPTIQPFQDVLPTLQKLEDRNVVSHLVTTGIPDRQNAKLKQLGLDRFFSDSRGTLQVIVPEDEQEQKDDAFRAAFTRMGVSPHDTLVVGDKLDVDIASGNRCGAATARVRHGRQTGREPAKEEERPDFEIDRIGQLLDII